jgi:hypothetical protein
VQPMGLYSACLVCQLCVAWATKVHLRRPVARHWAEDSSMVPLVNLGISVAEQGARCSRHAFGAPSAFCCGRIDAPV